MRLRRFFHRARWDRERFEELESHIRIEAEENIARGMPPAEAWSAARRKLGSSTLICEEIYNMNTLQFLDSLSRDLRYGWRMLRHHPGFTLVSLLTLAIGIGANTSVFSVLNSVLLRPLPYPKAEELVAVWLKAPGAEGLATVSGDLRLSASMYFTFAEHNRTLQSLGIWSAGTANVTGLAEPEQVRSIYISDGVLPALSVQPELGRWLSAADQKPGAPSTVMLSHGYWQRRFGGDQSVIGRKLVVNSHPREIAGVMPRSFRIADTECDVIMPLAFDRSKLILPGFGFQAIARLKTGVTIPRANADIARLVPVWMDSWPMVDGINPRIYENWRITPALRSLKQDVVGNVSDVLWLLMGMIAIVMLIAAANVANLMLVRAEARQQELAIRAALGAGWGRIVRAMGIESLLLALMGGALGFMLAHTGVRLLVAAGPGNLPRLSEISVDARALGFTIALSLLSALLFGLIPALKYAGPRVAAGLGSGGRTLTQSRARHRGRNTLVVAQIALALVLLVCSGLMIRTFQSLRAVSPGFTNPERIQIVRTTIPGSLVREPERVIRMQNDILDKLAVIPGVSSVAFTSEMPMESTQHNWDAVCTDGKKLRPAEIPPLRVFKSISPGLFATAGTRVIAGRDLTWTDLYQRRRFAIISENLAREEWGSPSAAIGKRISTCLPIAPWWEVTGVVQDVRDNGVHEPAPATVYWPAFGASLYVPGEVNIARSVTFAIRTDRAGAEGFLGQVSQAVWSVNASLPLASVRTMRDVYGRSLARTSFTLAILGIAAGMALTLGVIGIYGVLSYTVGQRRREIGIRLALGAQQSELKAMFVRHGLTLAGIGAAVGLVAAALLTRLMKSLLFGVSPLDPLTYTAVPVILASAAVLASYLPARRAAAVDPVEALKVE